MISCRIYTDIHYASTNAKLLLQAKEIGRENFWIAPGSQPCNMVEDYIQQYYKKFFTGPYKGIEYWVYIPPEGHTIDGFHFDKDEGDPQLTHPEWISCINLTYDTCATCVSDMEYGDIRPKEVLYTYGDEGKTVIWPGNYAWSDMAGTGEEVRIYLNIWKERRPQGLHRSKVIEWEPIEWNMLKKQTPIEYQGEYFTHTHMCGDTFDTFILQEPVNTSAGQSYLVTDAIPSTKS